VSAVRGGETGGRVFHKDNSFGERVGENSKDVVLLNDAKEREEDFLFCPSRPRRYSEGGVLPENAGGKGGAKDRKRESSRVSS